jgi:genome maintenance exonuclease 1
MDGHHPVPSVTTILAATASKESKQHLEDWKNRMGCEQAQQEVNHASSIGTQLHAAVEYELSGRIYQFKKSMSGVVAQRMFERIKCDVLPRIEHVVGIESNLIFPGLYAGSCDLVAVIDGKLTIFDWKNSKNIKKEEWIDDYKIQTAAYALAHDQMFQVKIQQTKIVMVSRPDQMGNVDLMEWTYQGDELESIKDKWLTRVEKYYA